LRKFLCASQKIRTLSKNGDEKLLLEIIWLYQKMLHLLDKNRFGDLNTKIAITEYSKVEIV